MSEGFRPLMIHSSVHTRIKARAMKEGVPMTEIVKKAMDKYERRG